MAMQSIPTPPHCFKAEAICNLLPTPSVARANKESPNSINPPNPPGKSTGAPGVPAGRLDALSDAMREATAEPSRSISTPALA